MSTARLASLVAALAVAALLLVWLGVAYGSRAFAAGIGLSCLGWILHDDAPRRAERDSTP